MSQVFIPEGYRSLLDVRQTEEAIKKVKDFFEKDLAIQLNLTRVSAPMFVNSGSGLNDTLNGVERPVSFDALDLPNDARCEIVQSLAKWKRYALRRYSFRAGEGLYTDMNAIRRDEELDNMHSMYVDQWDWELIIERGQRTEATLRDVVRRIYDSLKHTERYIVREYDFIGRQLPDEIYFITAGELEAMYPELTPKEREYSICRDKGAVFLMQIGGALRSGKPHDGRAPDYDDWTLNGDILVYYPVLDIAFELSSMGVRVDEAAMLRQLEERGCMERAELPFHKALLAGELPYTIGGGIGQSRMCMYYLRKAHIGEVQASIWPADMAAECSARGVELL